MPQQINELRVLDDDFWRKHIFYHILLFCKTHDKVRLTEIITNEKAKQYPRVERSVAKFLRKTLKNCSAFTSSGFIIKGEVTNDEDVEGNYDITINHSYWSKEFPFECKNLTDSSTLINEYVFVNNNSKTDGGVYRYFNGKYGQNQDFGAMIGFVLDGDISVIKDKIHAKLKLPFDIFPEGNLKSFVDNSIEGNDFTFTSIHSRVAKDFLIFHILMSLC